jgi:hypothetical protein
MRETAQPVGWATQGDQYRPRICGLFSYRQTERGALDMICISASANLGDGLSVIEAEVLLPQSLS